MAHKPDYGDGTIQPRDSKGNANEVEWRATIADWEPVARCPEPSLS